VGADLVRKAREKHYAIGGFNVDNVESTEAIVSAAEEMKSPIIVQVGQLALQYTELNLLKKIIQYFGDSVNVPVAIHLDHGSSFEQVIKCLRAGFSSVMFDGSNLMLEENIAVTKKVVEAAHAVGVSVEGELGQISRVGQSSIRKNSNFFTDPDEAERFVEKTNVDLLAVSIGSVHGNYKGESKLDLLRLKEIAQRVPVPLVLHGGTGVPLDEVKRSIEIGISKVNIATKFRRIFLESLRNSLCNEENTDWYAVMKEARLTMKDVVKEQLEYLGSRNKLEDFK